MSSEAITINDLKEILSGLSPLSLPRVNVGLVGEVRMYAGDEEPIGWLKCDGREISREDYADLFAVIGTSYGAGDGSTTFNLPDFCGRFPIGKGSIKTNTHTYWGSVTAAEVNCTLGERGGEAWHQLTANQLPKITGSLGPLAWSSNSISGVFTKGSSNFNLRNASSGTANSFGSQIYNMSFGNNEAHNNIPPYSVVNYIICAS